MVNLFGFLRQELTEEIFVLAVDIDDATDWGNKNNLREPQASKDSMKIVEYSDIVSGLAEKCGIDHEFLLRARLAEQGYSTGAWKQWTEEQKQYFDKSLAMLGRLEENIKPLLEHIPRTHAASCFISGRSKPDKILDEVPDLPDNLGLFAVNIEILSRWPWNKKCVEYLIIGESYSDSQVFANNKFLHENPGIKKFYNFCFEVDAGTLAAKKIMPALLERELQEQIWEDVFASEQAQNVVREAVQLIMNAYRTPNAQKILEKTEGWLRT